MPKINSERDDALLNTCRITEWNFDKGGYLSLLFGGLLMFACLISYAIAVLLGYLDAFLPLISDAAGSPPQNGVFGTLISIGGIIGVFFMFLRYMIVTEQNQHKSDLVKVINKISFGVGLASLFGITLIIGYPINFYRSRDVWLKYVGIPHMIGGVALFSLGLIYAAIQCVLTRILRPNNRQIFYLRTLLCLSTAVAFAYHLVTVPENFGGPLPKILNPNLNYSINNSDSLLPLTLILKLPIDMTDDYISSAIAEWIMVLLFCLFFSTFFSETQEYSLQIIIETQMPETEISSEVASDVYRYKDGPSTYVRKTSHAFGATPLGLNGIEFSPDVKNTEARLNTRRDSSCQTRLDFPSSKKFSGVGADTKITPLNSGNVGNETKTTSDKQKGEEDGNKVNSSSNNFQAKENGDLHSDKGVSKSDVLIDTDKSGIVDVEAESQLQKPGESCHAPITVNSNGAIKDDVLEKSQEK